MRKEQADVHFQLIELLAYWEGRVNSTDIIKHFSISVTQAKFYLKSYRARCPSNIYYDKVLKCFVPTQQFCAQFISTHVHEYLEWVTNHSTTSPSQLQRNRQPSYTHLRVPHRSVSPNIMRVIIAGIKQQKRVDTEYVSLTSPMNEGRIIHPHTLVKTGLRWHLRAYCEEKKEHRDFVLSRFRGDLSLLEGDVVTADKDTLWNKPVDLIFIANQRLSNEQKEIVEQDYNMQNGQLLIKTTAALAQYVVQEMQVSTKYFDITPEAQQLELANLVDVKQWLFNA
ncbi:WYL domain-containing protein [Glaciecola sp. SC05]|uniref:WYL domain-containing protein n=1 Tax=Glaciecola sp. SC05 TaxID=1987355 RepID=UPI0035270E96